MIRSFSDKRTKAFADGEFIGEFQGFSDQAAKRIRILQAATSLEDLRVLRSNRLEALAGNRSGQFSIRINMQWRISFRWTQEMDGPEDAEIVDYH